MFLVCGTATSSWAPMVPFAKAQLGLDEAALGMILLTLGGGSMASMPLAGVAIHRWGSRPVILLATLVTCTALPLLAVPGTPALLACTLFAFGAALGAMDVAMNAQAIAVQHMAQRPIMSGFHAMFSVGGLLGAALISVLLRAGAALPVCALIVGIGLLVLAVSQHRHLLSERSASTGATFTILPNRGVLLLGALCFITFLAEGVVLDWSAVFLREARQVDVAAAGIGYAAFSVAMTIGRLTGDRLTHRAGTTRMLRIGGALAAIGFLCTAGLPRADGALIGLVIVGFGASNIVPILFSASGRVPGVPPGIALATVTTIAYAGLLLGPALIGFVADATSLAAAFVMVAGMLAVVPLSAGLVTPKLGVRR